MRLHSFAGVLFAGAVLVVRSHRPSFRQQLFSVLPGNMKNCGHEMQPPHRSVASMSNDSTELDSAFSTALISGYQLRGSHRQQATIRWS